MQDTTRFLIPTPLPVLGLASLILGSPSPASARAGSGNFEIYFDRLALDEDDDDPTCGMRGRYRPTDHIGVETSPGHTDSEFGDNTFVDSSTQVCPGSSGPRGPGLAHRRHETIHRHSCPSRPLPTSLEPRARRSSGRSSDFGIHAEQPRGTA